MIDGGREVEIFDTLCVGLLTLDGFVVVILADHAKFPALEFAGKFGDETRFPGTAAARDSDGKIDGAHTAQT